MAVTFAPDQHRSVFARSWLAAHALNGYDDGDGRTEDDKELWLPTDLAGRRPEVRTPYRDPVPTVQLLHCLRASVKGDGPGGTGGGSPPCTEKVGGGDTGLVDGFAAAAALRAMDAESFHTLARTPVPFGYIDKETELRASLPLIQLSPRGRVRGVRFNNRSAQPLRLHVAAKRYLCATEPGYFALMSRESVRTLALQGGPMTAGQAAAFEALPFARDAVAVRRWDDEAKDPAVTPPAFAHFEALLSGLIRSLLPPGG